MKGLFPPNHLKGMGSGSSEVGQHHNHPQQQQQQQHNPLELQASHDADVSMDSHASAMTTESMTIGSPPRTQRKKRSSFGLRAGIPTEATATTNTNTPSNVRSRLFADDNNKHDNPHHHRHHHRHHNDDNDDDYDSGILKPFDLNQEFANSSQGLATAISSPGSLPTARSRQPSTLTPFRRRRDTTNTTNTGGATAALRKRQAEQDDLYGRDWLCSETNVEDAFSAAESPVDMYTSPRISPTKSSSSSSKNRVAMHRSPFYNHPRPTSRQSQQQQQQAQQQSFTKSPSHFQTLDGRTVQSKNPFSPMVFDDTPTPTPSRLLPPGNSPVPGATALGLTHPLLLTSDSLNDSSGGKSHLVLRHKLQKRGTTSPSHNKAPTTTTTTTRMVGMDGLGLANENNNNNKEQQQQQQQQQQATTCKYIRDGYPEPTGRYSFTGSPIKENFATTQHVTTENPSITTRSATTTITEPPPDFCTNIHKIRRRSKGDDVVAAAAQGESSWKKELYVNTNTTTAQQQQQDNGFLDFDNNNNNNSNMYNTIPNKSYFYNQQKAKNPKEDNISPTDVFSFPQFRASPSDTSTLPPTPSKPVRRPPVRRYTPIRRVNGPPPTPMPSARKPRNFGFDGFDDHDHDDTNHNTTTSTTTGSIFGDMSGDSSSDEDRGLLLRRRRLRPQGKITTTTMEKALPPSRFYSDFDVISELGSGSFGNVYKVLSRLDGCFYAIKVANRVAKGIADRDRMLKEVYALAALSDRADTATFHIVRYHQAWMEEERLYIQTELCTTTLQAELQLAAPKQLPLATRYKCLREILLALTFIHNNQMVHLDIKPENIFLKNDQFKLGDFGLVSKISSHDVEEGDSRYMSMELLSGDHADLTKSDIFSLGIAMYELCLGSNKNLPSNGPEWQGLRSGRILPPPNTTDELFQIIKQMMNPTFSERPSASDLLKLPELMSEDQKRMLREVKLSQALAARSIPKPKGLVRRNTWSAF